MMRCIPVALSLCLVVSLAGCGGRVVVDGRANGAGGAGGSFGGPMSGSGKSSGNGASNSGNGASGPTGPGPTGPGPTSVGSGPGTSVVSTGAGTPCGNVICRPGQVCDASGACVCASSNLSKCPDGCFDLGS